MALTAEPQPAELPLPGGQAGATVRLYPLVTGTGRFPPGFIDRPTGAFSRLRGLGVGVSRGKWVELPIPCFAVEHPGAGVVMIDTGLHPSVAFDPRDNLGSLTLRYSEWEMEPEQAAAAQLRSRGLDPRDVTTVVMTHLHNDHASAVSEFAGAEFVVDQTEWKAATKGGAWRKGYKIDQFDYAFAWRLVDFDANSVESFASFGRSIDLFGDGSIRLLSTPGHTPGHMSVALRLPDREALIAADAVYTRDVLAGANIPLIIEDQHRWKRSLKEIQRYEQATPGALIIPGHDLEAFRALDAVYG